MRLNLARPRATGASRRSALRAPSALRAAARRSFVTNMKIAPCFLRSCNHYQTLSVSSSVTNLANDGGRWAARLSLCHRSWRPTGWHLVVRSSTSLWRRWWSSVRSNVLRRPANRFSAGAGAVPSWAGRLRAPSSQAGERKAAALPALNELEDAWLACRQGGCTGPPWSFPRG